MFVHMVCIHMPTFYYYLPQLLVPNIDCQMLEKGPINNQDGGDDLIVSLYVHSNCMWSPT